MPIIPIFMYHHVNPNRDDMVTVSPDTFEAHLQHIRHAGYKTLSLDDVVSFLSEGGQAPEKSLVLTFDDGYLDNYIYAFPLLKRYGLKATIFAVTGWLDAATEKGVDRDALLEEYKRKPATHDEAKKAIERGDVHRIIMDWTMAREMQEAGVCEFYSHTLTHRNCDALGEDELKAELKGSRDAVERNLNRPCPYLCWPRGRFSQAAVATAKEAGYTGLLTTQLGVVKKGEDPFTLKRIPIKEGAQWFRGRLKVYTSPILSEIYLRMK